MASSGEGEGYWLGAYIVGVIAAIIAWIYAIATYGFFLGVGLGWIPALVIGAIVGLLWPLVLALVLGLLLLLVSQVIGNS